MKTPLVMLALGALAAAGGLVARQPSTARAAPAVSDVQRAYDEAAGESGSRHTAGLKVLGVQCDKTQKGSYSCEVGFSLPESEEGRVFLDAALVEPEASGWKLLTGLCKRYN